MIRIDQIWPAVDPINMRCGANTTLAKVVRKGPVCTVLKPVAR